MTTVALPSGRRDDMPGIGAAVPIELRVEDSLQRMFAPIRGMSGIMAALIAGSVAVHLVVLVTTIVAARGASVAPLEAVNVEVVREMPKEAPKPPPIQPRAVAELDGPKAVPPKAVAPPPKAEPPKIEPLKIERAKADPPKPEPLKVQEARVQEAQVEQRKPEAEATERESLQKEIAALRAEQAQIKAAEAAVSSPPPDLGMGPLPGSFQAVALPLTSRGVGEAMGFEEIVFSQLAKANDMGQRQGIPGTTGVHFEVDAAGGLASVEIVQPSGNAVLDREALEIVHRAAPFPPPPPGARRSFVANVNFVPRGH